MANLFRKTITSFAAVFTALALSVSAVAYAEPTEAAADVTDAAHSVLFPTGGFALPEPEALTEEESIKLHETVLADEAAYQKELAEGTVDIPESDGAGISSYTLSSNYYYNKLSAAGKELYNNLKTVCEDFYNSSKTLSTQIIGEAEYDENSLSESDAILVYYQFYYTNPKYFFIDGSISYGYSGSTYYIAPKTISAFKNATTRNKYKSTIESTALSWLSAAEAKSNILDKERLIIEKLADHTDYHYDANGNVVSSENNQTMAGAIYDKTCVCNGYALTTAYFFNALGLDTFVVCSKGHAWNVVNIYDNYYEVDVTWADPDWYKTYGDKDSENLQEQWINKSHSTFLKNDNNSSHVYVTDKSQNKSLIPACTRDTVYVPTTTTYKVTFETNGGSSISPVTVESGKTVSKPSDPTRSGYTFAGWYSDSGLTQAYNFSAKVTGNLTLYAKWEEKVVVYYTVTFDSKGGSAVAAATVESGKTVSKPADPILEGYTFNGWYSDSGLTQAYNFSAKVTGSLTLYAKWTKNGETEKFAVTINDVAFGGSTTLYIESGSCISASDLPDHDGYSLIGLYTDSMCKKVFKLTTPVTGNLTLYAVWDAANVIMNGIGYTSLSSAFAQIGKNDTGSFDILLTGPVSETKLTLPNNKNITVTIDGNNNYLTLAPTSISPKFPLILKNINIISGNTKGAFAINAGSSLTLDTATYSGANLTLYAKNGDLIVNGLSSSGSSPLLTIKGGTKNNLYVSSCSIMMQALTGFDKMTLNDFVSVYKTFTPNNVELHGWMLLFSTTSANIKKTLSGDGTIYFEKGFKPITLKDVDPNASISLGVIGTDEDGNIDFGKFDYGTVIFKTKVDNDVLNSVFSFGDALPGDGTEAYPIAFCCRSGKAYLAKFVFELTEPNGNSLCWETWNDIMTYIGRYGNGGEYTLKLLDNVYTGSTLKLPTKGKCGRLIIQGEGHFLLFKGTTVNLTSDMYIYDITMTSVNNKAESVNWKLNKKNFTLFKDTDVLLYLCTEN